MTTTSDAGRTDTERLDWLIAYEYSVQSFTGRFWVDNGDDKSPAVPAITPAAEMPSTQP